MKIKEIFASIQGEGHNAGQRAVFVRFAGCNMWSGLESERGAGCSAWCDTDFVGGLEMSVAEIVTAVAAALEGPEWVVLTGGEPGLQATRELVFGLKALGRVAIETNGTVDVSGLGLDWICVSPKVPARHLRQKHGDELKVIHPAFDPLDFAHLDFTHRYAQPLDDGTSGAPTALWVVGQTRWRLSVQTHKVVGLR